jgi:hypothetical protein
MLSSLANQEFDERYADFCLFGVKLLVAAKLEQLLVIVRLACHLTRHLGKHDLELNRAHPVKN